MKRNYFFIIVCILPTLIGCAKRDELIEQINPKKIEERVSRDIPALANCSAVINLVFSTFKDNWIATDDIYLVEGVAEIHYGFDLDKIRVKVVERNGKRILLVSLPEIMEISRNWEVKNIYQTHKNYIPKDDNGNYIDVNKKINEQLDECSKKYKEKAQKIAVSAFKYYMGAIASQFNLELELQIERELTPTPQELNSI